ncbi:MAG: ABC transporter ATP-binding protein [Alphaproteobacteria bacterium]|nr:ABC transporter ATP-binding protein [Alphaproteobacteria bacterium]
MLTKLEVSNLTKTYDSNIAVNNISFSLGTGITALLGPNGAGKSTLMNIIAGFLSSDSGEIKINNFNTCKSPIYCKNEIGFLPEGSPLYSDMSVRSFLTYIASLRDLNKNAVSLAAQKSQIENVMHKKIETLSKGYQRRVGFAQSIISNPNILLLDEPTDGLDPNQKEHILKLIKEMSQNKIIFISTHLLDEAETIADKIIIMDQGQIKIQGTLSAILKKTDSKTLAQAFKKLTSSAKSLEHD